VNNLIKKEIEEKTDNLFDMNLDSLKKNLENSSCKEKNFTPRKDLTSEKLFYSTPRKSITENLFHFNKQDSKYHQKIENQKLKKICIISDKDKTLFNSIEEIVNEFVKNFASYSHEQIFDCLKNNSFNLENTYLQLKNPHEFESIRLLIILITYLNNKLF